MGTKEQILEAACELIAIQGFGATSLDQILTRSGVKKGSFYFHFKSKEELGFAIIEKMEAQFRQHVLEPVFGQPDRTPIERILLFIDRALEGQKAKRCCGGCPFGNLALELSDTHEGFRKRIYGYFYGVVDCIEQCFEQASDCFKPGTDLKALAQFLFSSVEGTILLGKVSKDIRDVERCFDQLRLHIFGQLKPEIAAAYKEVAHP